ncbi:hypothetical protein BaRGS_00027022 [Batillaria attramentaria]|uniref:Uncharacterized protein n=1 Tax=Batillaria attramentaria TaxID=370345 RepID=A0ABD0K3C9_9CAEN
MADSKLLLTLFLLVLPQAMYATEGTCLKFEFKNLTKETITRDENSTFRLLFTTVVSPPTCANTTLPENFTIVVSKTASLPLTSLAAIAAGVVVFVGMFADIESKHDTGGVLLMEMRVTQWTRAEGQVRITTYITKPGRECSLYAHGGLSLFHQGLEKKVKRECGIYLFFTLSNDKLEERLEK